MTNMIETLKSRRSNPNLAAPGPSLDQQKEMLACALRAPDHAGLKPWRYIFVQGAGLAQLGELYKDAYCQFTNDDCEEKINKMASLPNRAPLVVIAIAKYTEHAKVPREEQIASCAAGVQNLLLAADSMGYACYWRTGQLAQNPILKAKLKLAELDEVVGFVYIGTAVKELNAKIPLDIEPFCEFWD